MGAVYICECGHEKSRHKRARDGCRALDCGCGQFEADLKASAQAQGATLAGQPTETVAAAAKAAAEQLPTVGEWPGEPRAEQERDAVGVKLVGALRERAKAERERDSLARRCAVRFEEAEKLRAALAEVQAEMDERRAERDAARSALKTVGEQRDLARAELDSARQELEKLRASLDKAARERGKVRAANVVLVDELEQLRTALTNTSSAYLATTATAAADVLYAYDAWSCLTEGGCGSRYTMPAAALEHRCGPLTPVRVSITHREEEPTA